VGPKLGKWRTRKGVGKRSQGPTDCVERKKQCDLGDKKEKAKKGGKGREGSSEDLTEKQDKRYIKKMHKQGGKQGRVSRKRKAKNRGKDLGGWKLGRETKMARCIVVWGERGQNRKKKQRRERLGVKGQTNANATIPRSRFKRSRQSVTKQARREEAEQVVENRFYRWGGDMKKSLDGHRLGWTHNRPGGQCPVRGQKLLVVRSWGEMGGWGKK